MLVNNFYLICDKIYTCDKPNVNVVECGVYNGGTLIPVSIYCDTIDKQVNITGIDSFKGFPKTEIHPIDKFDTFTIQHFFGDITTDHYEKATECYNSSYLNNEYFNDVSQHIFDFAKENDIRLVEGYFDNLLQVYDQDIDVLFLDCDLYESYLSCLHNLYDNITPGGCVIFDEYFTYKYPGAKVAIDEFFEPKSGYFERYKTPSDYERWCYIKE